MGNLTADEAILLEEFFNKLERLVVAVETIAKAVEELDNG